MDTPTLASWDAEARVRPARRARLVRSILLAVGAIWFLLQAFMGIEEDSTHEVVALLQRLAFGFALVTVALFDWREARWWWLLVALLVVAAIWVATGHPLLFLVGV